MSKEIEPIKYYNSIAETYDATMNTNTANSIRSIVSEYFTSISGIKRILDFGAGTGNDLNWQLQAGYEIVFYEPSIKMAMVAEEKHNIEKHQQVKSLVGSQANYENLEKDQYSDLDAIISNFAVINSIKDLNNLFAILSKVLKKEGHLICILYNQLSRISRLKSYILPDILTRKTNVSTNNSNHSMPVYLHTKKQLVDKATSNGLIFENEIHLESSSGQILYHFIKK